ncbi:hypothetical protein ANN_17398 [Periplaneta americana]|uniref:Uncharacterized protein n=1 Tax=Periplaneta americana TaxID=6978 RepID=A0ABQ8SSU8_PERAM|nr:hypothetical protein ANN_17398 [Periplaneta americana]
MSTGSTAPPKHSKWEFFQRLQFLEMVSKERNTASNVDSDSAVASTSANQQPENSEGCPNEASQLPKPLSPRKK